jgi:hypothetical protein
MAYIATYALGSIGYLWQQAQDTAADIGIMLLKSAGLEPEDTLADYQTVAALLAGSNDEASFPGYVRKTFPDPVQTVDTATNRLILTTGAAPPVVLTWPAAPAGDVLGKVIFYYDPAPGSSTDAQKTHLWGGTINIVTDGGQPTVTIPPGGIATARNAA